MTSYTSRQARGFIYDTFFAHWNDAANGWDSIPELSAAPPVRVDNVASGVTPANSPWLRIFIRHNDSEQATLGEPGGRIFRRTGLVEVDIFLPEDIGLSLADDLVNVVKNAFEGQRGVGDGCGIWFRNVRWNEIGVEKDTKMYGVAVLADFEYDEVL